MQFKPVVDNRKGLYFIYFIVIGIGIAFVNYFLTSKYNGPLLLLTFLLMVVLIVISKDRSTLLYGFITLIVLYLIGTIEFEYFAQARALYRRGSNPWELLIKLHPHSLRYIVSYPAVWLSKIFDVDIDRAYTFYCIMLLSFMLVNINETASVLRKAVDNPYSPLLRGIIGVLPIVILSSLMNGRLVPAFTGMSIIIRELTALFVSNKKLNIGSLSILFFGFFISTVSSGTMMVAAGEITVGLIIYAIKFGRYGVLLLLSLVFSPILFLFTKFIILMANRNLTYFGGGLEGFLKMLNHGFGTIFHSSPLIVFSICLVTLCFIVIMSKVYFYFLRNRIKYIPLVISIPIAFFGGFFGISTALMVVPSLIVVGLLMLRI